MEEPSLHGVSNNGDSGNASRPSGCIAASDEGSVDDPPPIPSASLSAIKPTEKSVGKSRFDKNKLNIENDFGHICHIAHTLPAEDVANGLATDTK